MKPDRFFLWSWCEEDGGFWDLFEDNIVVEADTHENQLWKVRKNYLGRACVFLSEMVYGCIYEGIHLTPLEPTNEQ